MSLASHQREAEFLPFPFVEVEALEHLAAERGDDRLRAEALARQATIYRTPTTRFDARVGQYVSTTSSLPAIQNRIGLRPAPG